MSKYMSCDNAVCRRYPLYMASTANGNSVAIENKDGELFLIANSRNDASEMVVPLANLSNRIVDALFEMAEDQTCPPKWRANVFYTLGLLIRPTIANGYWYVCAGETGVSGQSEPEWSTTVGKLTQDAKLYWTSVVVPSKLN